MLSAIKYKHYWVNTTHTVQRWDSKISESSHSEEKSQRDNRNSSKRVLMRETI